MKKTICLALACLPMVLAGCAHREVVAYPPPPAYNEAAQQGYRDGVHAAQRDIHNGLRPDADRHPNFRNPPVPPPLRDDFRRGFREGYEQVFHGGRGPGY